MQGMGLFVMSLWVGDTGIHLDNTVRDRFQIVPISLTQGRTCFLHMGIRFGYNTFIYLRVPDLIVVLNAARFIHFQLLRKGTMRLGELIKS